MTLDQWLAHLLHLMSKYPEGWKAHCWHRAKELAKQPGLEELPARLAEAVKSSASAESGAPAGKFPKDGS